MPINSSLASLRQVLRKLCMFKPWQSREPLPGHCCNRALSWDSGPLRAAPHGRQAGRTVGAHWSKQSPGYHTIGCLSVGHLTWPGRLSVKSSREGPLELRSRGAMSAARRHRGGVGTELGSSPSSTPGSCFRPRRPVLPVPAAAGLGGGRFRETHTLLARLTRRQVVFRCGSRQVPRLTWRHLPRPEA